MSTTMNYVQDLGNSERRRFSDSATGEQVTSHMNTSRRAATEHARFWARVKVKDGCWEWLGGVTSRGYGWFGTRAKQWLAHRYSWTLARGEIPKGLFVCHRCDNPTCVRPDHLFTGTAKENTSDMISKGRGRQGLSRNAEKSHCVSGHPFDAANTYVWNGHRICRACNRAAQRRRAERCAR